MAMRAVSFCIGYLSIYFVLNMCVAEIEASSLVNSMTKVTNLYASLISTGTRATTVSTVVCASMCSRDTDTCFCFSFNSKTRECTLGSWLFNALSLREPDTRIFLEETPCKQYVDFKLYSSGNVSSCLWISCILLTYIEAQRFCLDFNATLYTIKVIEKLYMLDDAFSAMYPSSTTSDTWAWVGLNELEQLGSYRWEDDGSELDMSSSYAFDLFSDGQPSDRDYELCMSYSSTSYYPLHDISCDATMVFICEKSQTIPCL